MLARWTKPIIALSLLGGTPLWLCAQTMGELPAATTHSAAAAPVATTRPVLELTAQQELQRLSDQLNSETLPQNLRDEAARRLVTWQNSDASQILNRTLQTTANRSGQLAVARALAYSTAPDGLFVNPLFALIGSDKSLNDAALRALATYKTNEQVTSRIINLSNAQQPRDIRLSAINALGSLIDKRAAAALVNLLQTDTNDNTQQAAMDALTNMTGLVDNRHEIARWRQWWQSVEALSDADWQTRLLDSRAVRFDQMQHQLERMHDEVQSILTSQYATLSDAQRIDAVLRYLKSTEPVIRETGAKIVYDDVMNNRPATAAVRGQLRELISDSTAYVRIAAIKALQVINDPDALGPLLSQLSHEPDADAQIELAKSLSTLGDPRAVVELITLLKSPDQRVQLAAAKALRDLGAAARDQDSNLSHSIATALRQALRDAGDDAAAQTYRTALVEAMVVLRDPSLRNIYYRLLDQRVQQPTSLRRAAVEALGELRDPKVADMLATALDDRDESVRMEALRALGKTPTFSQAESIYIHLSPNVESAERMRNEAWRVLQSLLPYASREQLQDWARRFVAQPQQRIAILKVLSEKLIAADEPEQLALTQQNIGEVYMNLNQPADAAVCFRDALKYWQSRNGQEMVTQGLVRQALEALLRSRQYDDAVKFSEPLISADSKNQEVVGSLIRAEASRLLEAQDFTSVITLTELAAKMVPALDSRYAGVLKGIADEARQHLQMQEKAPNSGGPRSAVLTGNNSGIPRPQG